MSVKMFFKKGIEGLFLFQRNKRIVHSQNSKIRRREKMYDKPIQGLSSSQKKEIRSYFASYGLRCGTIFHSWLYTVSGFYSSLYIHPGLYYTKIEPALNNITVCEAWADKNYYDLFFPNIRFPYSIAHCISGRLLDHNYKPINKDKFVELCSEYESVVIKPSIDSGGGNAVKLVRTDGAFLKELKPYYSDGNFVIQTVSRQHESMRLFNESSVNIVRIVSILLDGVVEIASAALRVGAPGKFNDNYIDEQDGSMLTIGINQDGTLKEKAFFASGKATDACLNGYKFKGVKIVCWEEMKVIACKMHIKLAHFGMIGWDFYVDEDGHPSVMEYNTHWQGITYYQYTNGPLFKDKDLTDRVLSFVQEYYKNK